MKIELNHKTIPIDLPETLIPDNFGTVFEKQTVDFIKRWLEGQDEFVIHSSGTTGNPKPLLFQRKQLEISAELTARTFGLKTGDTILVALNTAYVAGIMMLVRGLHLGLNMIILEPDSNPLHTLEDDLIVDFTALVPMQVEGILEDPKTRNRFNSVRQVIIGGAVLSDMLEKKLQNLHPRCFHTYAMTETLTHVAIRKLNGLDKSDVFMTLEGVEIGLDERGCLKVSSPVTLGQEIVTNDLVELLGDGKFRWNGRVDHVINSGGVKVHPEKVEGLVGEVFLALGFRNAYFVAGIPHELLGEEVVLYLESGGNPDLPTLQQALKSRLPAYECPKRILVSDCFARTSTGKIKRKETMKQQY